MSALTTLPKDFRDKVKVVSTGCWEWQAAVTKGGYGRFWTGRRTVLVHRFSYERSKGPIAEGLHVDHLCRNRRCCNPEHLEAVTPNENWKRGDAPSRHLSEQTHCKRGHPLTPGNYYEKTLRTGGKARQCKQCTALLDRQRRAAFRAQGLNNRGQEYRYAAYRAK